MKDYFSRILKWIDYNRWLFTSVVMFVIITSVVLSTIGCQSTTMGLDGTKVNRSTFNTQVESQIAVLNAKIESGYVELDRQDEIKQRLVDTASMLATGGIEGTLNPLTLIPTGVGLAGLLLGLGANKDKRRTDEVLLSRKTAA